MTQVPIILTIDAASTDTHVVIRSVLPQGFDQPDLIAAASQLRKSLSLYFNRPHCRPFLFGEIDDKYH